MEHIMVRGRKYPLVDDVEYVYAKRFRRLQNQQEQNKIEDADEALIELLAEAVCPKLKLDRENMSVEGKNLTFGEVKKLVLDLRDAFENIIERQLDILLDGRFSKDGKNTECAQGKNFERATEESISAA